MTRFTDLLRRAQMAATRLPFSLDIYALIGAAIALLVLLLFYFLLVAPEGSEVSTPAAVFALLIAVSPLVVAYRVEQTARTKVFSDFRDFSVAVAWFPLTVLVMLMTQQTAIIVTVMVCGFLVDPVVLGSRRTSYPTTTRIMMAYSRGLCGIFGTILALTFVAKLMDIGNPRNKKTLVQEIFSAVLWGYIGKKFFDFIGVTKPIPLGSLFPRTRGP